MYKNDVFTVKFRKILIPKGKDDQKIALILVFNIIDQMKNKAIIKRD